MVKVNLLVIFIFPILYAIIKKTHYSAEHTLHLMFLTTFLILASQKAPLYLALTSVPTGRNGGSSPCCKTHENYFLTLNNGLSYRLYGPFLMQSTLEMGHTIGVGRKGSGGEQGSLIEIHFRIFLIWWGP